MDNIRPSSPLAQQIHLIPEQELGPGQAAAIRNEVVKNVVELAVRELKLSPDKLLVRDIQPSVDVTVYTGPTTLAAMTTIDWYALTGATAGVWENLATGNMGDNRYCALYGIKDTSVSQSVSAIRLNISGSNRVIWMLEPLYSNNDGSRVGISPAAAIIKQNQPYTVSRYVVDTKVQAYIALKGIVVEPVGKTLTP